MELRDKYIFAISREEAKKPQETREKSADIDDMRFALEFLKFTGRKEASPNEIAAVAKVSEFYRKYYSAKPSAVAEQSEEESHEE